MAYVVSCGKWHRWLRFKFATRFLVLKVKTVVTPRTNSIERKTTALLPSNFCFHRGLAIGDR